MEEKVESTYCIKSNGCDVLEWKDVSGTNRGLIVSRQMYYANLQ